VVDPRGDAAVDFRTYRSEGAEMLRNRGCWVHRLPDGSYKITQHKIETFCEWEWNGKYT